MLRRRWNPELDAPFVRPALWTELLLAGVTMVVVLVTVVVLAC